MATYPFTCRDLSHLTTLWSELQKTSMKFDKRFVPWCWCWLSCAVTCTPAPEDYLRLPAGCLKKS